MGHESYERQDDVEGISNRSFGLVFAFLFAAVGFLPLLSGRGVRSWALLIGALFLATALFAPTILEPLSRLWMKFGLLLHRLISPVALGVMFFLVITPIGLIMRMLGKDPLRLKSDHSAQSYWIPRDPPGPPPESLKDQF